MIIKPNPVKIDALYERLKKSSDKLAKYSIPFCVLMLVGVVLIMFILGELVDDLKSIDVDDLFSVIPVLAIVGVVLGFIVKSFIKNILLKENATLISEIKNSGIKIEGELITGRMMKMDERTTTKSNSAVQVIPRKSNDVAFKLSQISNIEVSDKRIQETDYSKFCAITVGSEKYYLMCLDDNDAVELRNYVLNLSK
ncbi:MAG: hypothetical protein IJZ57_04920 [Clostridia bacterium]|nr:hypothetical protein [Clostridia bacterium]